MICRHCSQWNPDGQPRCCFCNNLLAGEKDETLSGAPGYLRSAELEPVKLPDRSPALLEEDRTGGLLGAVARRTGLRTTDELVGIVAVVVVLAVILGLWRC